MTGYAPTAEGQVTFTGRDITRAKPHRSARGGLAQTFQSTELFDDLPVSENLVAANVELSMGLAPVIVQRLLPILRWAAVEFGAAVLFAEQHVSLSLKTADRAYLLNHGRIVLEGTAAELLEQRDLVTSSYLGPTTTG